MTLAELEVEYDLKLIDTDYDIRLDYAIELPSPEVSSRELDAMNAEGLLGALPNLTSADATDERLWVTLALGDFREYVQLRWPKDASQLGNHLINHVFTGSARRRERDHAIARLWWSGSYVRQFAPADMAVSLQAFFANSDLSVQLLGRPNLATVEPIARGLLAVCRRYFLDQNVPYNRQGIRSLLEGLDFLAGRRALGVLDDETVESLIEQSFREHLGLDRLSSQ